MTWPARNARRNGRRKLVSQFKTNQWSQFLDTMERKISPHKFK